MISKVQLCWRKAISGKGWAPIRIFVNGKADHSAPELNRILGGGLILLEKGIKQVSKKPWTILCFSEMRPEWVCFTEDSELGEDRELIRLVNIKNPDRIVTITAKPGGDGLLHLHVSDGVKMLVEADYELIPTSIDFTPVDEDKPGEPFEGGLAYDNPKGVPIRNSRKELRWIAYVEKDKKWSIRVHFSNNLDPNYIYRYGLKITDPEIIRRVVVCGEKELKAYLW